MAGTYDRGMAGLKDVAGSLSRIGLTTWLMLMAYTLLIIGIYSSSLKWLVYNDWVMEDHNHCYLIPFILVYLIWEKRQMLASSSAAPSRVGLVPLGIGLLLFWLGELGGEYYTLYISLWLTVIGLIWLHWGWEKMKVIAFPVIFALTMFPFPSVINNPLGLRLKLISSQLGTDILHACGMSAYREGNIIDLGFTQLQVVDACSGLRYIMPLLVLSLLLAYWLKARWWKRVIVVLSSIPLAIVVNGLRIAITGILYKAWGAEVAEGFFHGFSSWLIFLAMIPFLLGEIWVLGKLPPKEERGTRDEAADAAMGDSAATDKRVESIEQTSLIKQLFQPVFIVAIVLLGSTLVLSHVIDFREKVPLSKPFGSFPLQIGEWTGRRQSMDPESMAVLTFSDYTMVNYKNSQGRDMSFYVAYYQSQRGGESIHSPETCLPGSGWEFREAGATAISIPNTNAGSIKVNRAFMENVGQHELAYYWFPMRGRILTSLYQLKIYNFWDALTKRRTDGALVRLITPVYPSESLQDAEARLQEFTRDIVPVLKEYIPE